MSDVGLWGPGRSPRRTRNTRPLVDGTNRGSRSKDVGGVGIGVGVGSWCPKSGPLFVQSSSTSPLEGSGGPLILSCLFPSFSSVLIPHWPSLLPPQFCFSSVTEFL